MLRAVDGHMSDDSNFQIISPPNRLRIKVPRKGGPDLQQMQAASEDGLKSISAELEEVTQAELEAMMAAMSTAKADPAQAEEAFAEILRRAADIKGQAAAFDNPLLGDAAASLTTYLEQAGTASAKKAGVVETHLRSMQLILTEGLSDTKKGNELMSALKHLVSTTLGP